MTQLAANVNVTVELWTLDSLPTTQYVDVGDETVEVRARWPSSYYTLTGETLPPKIRVHRGVGGTTAASHLSGASLTPNYGLGSGAGAGGVTVDNQSDPPAAVTTLIVPGATLAGDEATISSPWAVQVDGSLQADLMAAVLVGPAVDALLPDDARFAVLGTGGVVIDSVQPTNVGLTLTVPNNQSSPRLSVEDANAVAFQVLGKGNVQWGVAVGATHILRVFDELGNVVFQINADGTVHILTGGSIVADL